MALNSTCVSLRSTKCMQYFRLAIRKTYLDIDKFVTITTGKADFVISKRKHL